MGSLAISGLIGGIAQGYAGEKARQKKEKLDQDNLIFQVMLKTALDPNTVPEAKGPAIQYVIGKAPALAGLEKHFGIGAEPPTQQPLPSPQQPGPPGPDGRLEPPDVSAGGPPPQVEVPQELTTLVERIRGTQQARARTAAEAKAEAAQEQAYRKKVGERKGILAVPIEGPPKPSRRHPIVADVDGKPVPASFDLDTGKVLGQGNKVLEGAAIYRAPDKYGDFRTARRAAGDAPETIIRDYNKMVAETIPRGMGTFVSGYDAETGQPILGWVGAGARRAGGPPTPKKVPGFAPKAPVDEETVWAKGILKQTSTSMFATIQYGQPQHMKEIGLASFVSQDANIKTKTDAQLEVEGRRVFRLATQPPGPPKPPTQRAAPQAGATRGKLSPGARSLILGIDEESKKK